MKKCNKLVFLAFAPMLLLSSCGFGLSEVVFGDAYNSVRWNDNYYRVWDAKIDVHSEHNSITKVVERELDRDTDRVFLTYDDNAFKLVEPDYDKYRYDSDVKYDDKGRPYGYGKNHNMSGIDNSFKYNITSKLFDGQCFCNRNYEKARIQVAPTNNFGEEPGLKDGFGRLFKKEMRTGSYFAMNFKCSVDYKSTTLAIPAHICKIKLHLSFYLRNETGYTQYKVNYDMDNVPSNTGDGIRANDYCFFGFQIHSSEDDHYIDLTRCIGMSIQYDLVEDHYSTENQLGHSMLVYEALFPHSTWY